MTCEEVIAKLGNKLTGVFICDNADDARLITDILRDLGYRWDVLYTTTGKEMRIVYRFDPR